MNPQDLAVTVLLQFAVILGACKLTGRLATLVGQPQVIGEVIAGILLGPSVLGYFFPQAQAALFPPETKGVLFVNATLGLALYMFLVGVEFNPGMLKGRLKATATISLTGMLLPFVAGAAIVPLMLREGGYFTTTVSSGCAMLYLGACMSITAFPTLARIIHERGLTGTALGTITLGAGSLDDAAAWLVLAVVLAFCGPGGGESLTTTFVGSLGFMLLVLTAGRYLMRRLADRVERRGVVEAWVFSTVLIVVLLGAWYTDKIRLYAVFGAFLIGTVVPAGKLAHELENRLGSLCSHLLLPLFFTFSGLHTRLDLIGNTAMLGMTALVIVAAVVGKGGGCWLAARATGVDNSTALAVGTLMNARGMMELIILGIGLQYAIITPVLYTVMVVMAVVTTLMTYPLFNRIRFETTASALPSEEPVLP